MYYIFRIEWSQTDHETIIVKASSKERAQDWVDEAYATAFYRDHLFASALDADQYASARANA